MPPMGAQLQTTFKSVWILTRAIARARVPYFCMERSITRHCG
ncbi:MAG TPA: hypothetical protein ACFE0H_00150 [Elainellaceae cyanobacterium]